MQCYEKIIFASTCCGNYEMLPDGSEVVQITTDGTDNREPDWSPDGSQITFKSTRKTAGENPGGDFEKADGSNVRQRTHDSRDERHPVFSVDGKKVYYVSMTAEGQYQWYSVAVNGGAVNQLTEMVGGGKMPAVSSDGRWLLFQTDGGPETNDTRVIYKMRPDGLEQTRLTCVESKEKRTSWSPDGKKIVFQSTRSGHWEIYTMNSDGSEQKHITKGECDFHMPKWPGFLKQK